MIEDPPAAGAADQPTAKEDYTYSLCPACYSPPLESDSFKASLRSSTEPLQPPIPSCPSVGARAYTPNRQETY